MTENIPKYSEILRLGACLYDLQSFVLKDKNGQFIALRRQSEDVLKFLATNANRIVTKDQIFEAVWGETFVTDDSLVQCIGDIRRALADDARQIVETIPKKGYRLNAESAGDAVERAGTRRGLVLAAVLFVALGLAGWAYFGQSQAPGTGSVSRPRIAVMPFDDFSVGADKGYLSDAIAEGIITELARNQTLAVIARNSSFRYRESDQDMRQIGEELGVHYILEGSKQKNGDKLRVTAQLIEVANGEHVWAHVYDHKIDDFFVVQDQIVRTVADRIGWRIEKPLPVSDGDKVTALHYNLKARVAIREEFNAENNQKMFEFGLKSIEVDPDSKYGYLTLAFYYRHAATFGWHDLDHEKAVELGLQNGHKALELDPDDPEIHYALARLLNEAGETEAAMARFDHAIALNPSASSFLAASTSPMLMRGGREDEAIARLEQAMGIDPHHPDWFHWQMGWALWEKEECDAALDSFMKMKLIPKGSQRMLAGIYACLGDVENAQKSYQIFYADAKEPTISEMREAWKDDWTAPGSLERFLDHMRIAGMKD